MAKMALTDTEVRNAKPVDKAYKLTDAQGMFLLVATTDNKMWRMSNHPPAKPWDGATTSTNCALVQT